MTAGHAFQRLGDLTLQLHGTDDGEERYSTCIYSTFQLLILILTYIHSYMFSKWTEGDVEQLREALTKFAHELDTISERVQTRTMFVLSFLNTISKFQL